MTYDFSFAYFWQMLHILGIVVDLFSDGKVLPQLQEVNRNNLILMVQVLF